MLTLQLVGLVAGGLRTPFATVTGEQDGVAVGFNASKQKAITYPPA